MAAIAAFLNPDDKGHLKAELQNLRRKGALKPSADWDSTGPDPDRSCGRCRVELGRVINRGAYCRACRLKVCKGCREYSFRTTDWVCTVCHKHMEIQAASGEWMNEFVRRPSRRRDNRVYVPAADIIKRTIRRSWTISNPTPRWNVLRGSPELRPYNSLPRGQDINSYPSLALHHHANSSNPPATSPSSPAKERPKDPSPNPSPRKHSPCRRTLSEDIYGEGCEPIPNVGASPVEVAETKKPVRVNPLIRFGEGKKSSKGSPRHKTQKAEAQESKEVKQDSDEAETTPEKKADKTHAEKRVSFDSNIEDRHDEDKRTLVYRTQSLTEGGSRGPKASVAPRSKTEGDDSSILSAEVHFAREREEDTPLELCDIEPLSGTVFRKVTVRRRRQDMRKVPAVDTGWRKAAGADAELLEILGGGCEDYKLVFLSSDSSSKEEELDDNDSSSASSFPIDECDWDYFEPGAPVSLGGSPRTVDADGADNAAEVEDCAREEVAEVSGDGDGEVAAAGAADGDMEEVAAALQCVVHQVDVDLLDVDAEVNIGAEESEVEVHVKNSVVVQQEAPCSSCGAPAQFIPIPVPVPIPFPVPALWPHHQEAATPLVVYGEQRLRVLPRGLWPYVSQAALIFPLISSVEPGVLHSLFRTGADRSHSTGPADNNNTSAANSMPTVFADRDRDSSPSAGNRQQQHPEPANREVHHGQQQLQRHLDHLEQHLQQLDLGPQEQQEQEPSGDEERYPRAQQGLEPQDVDLCGHVDFENRFDSESSRDSSDDDGGSANSDVEDGRDGDGDGANVRENRPPVHRVYNVNGGDPRESDDALPSSNVTSDCEDDRRSHYSSVREDDMSSSGSADTDSDDTGTVADQKPKRFVRTFIVNKNLSSSSATGSSSDTDTSDNDTDTEMDCTVVLTNIKHLEEDPLPNADAKEAEAKSDGGSARNSRRGSLVAEEEEEEEEEDIPDASKLEHEFYASSPGLSDVSAESLSSSDAGFGEEGHQHQPRRPPPQESARSPSAESPSAEDRETGTGERGPSPSSVEGARSGSGSGDSAAEKVGASPSSSSPSTVGGEGDRDRDRAGASVTAEPDIGVVSAGAAAASSRFANAAARYTSLVMITGQEPAPAFQQVSVVTSDTTTLVPSAGLDSDVIVKHTNWQDAADDDAKDAPPTDNQSQLGESVTVITGGDTLSAFEEGLADDDSWVENLSHDDDDEEDDDDDDFGTTASDGSTTSGEEVTLTCSAVIDHEDELRGYHRAAIDFTLHTIVEESCEDSEVEQSLTSKERKAAQITPTDLEKYFFFRLGDGNLQNNSGSNGRDDALSESSSICSESLDSLGATEEPPQSSDNTDNLTELASSRLEKYFLSGFMGYTAERRDSDGSVGSDSEGRPSPEQRRKRLVRARGTGRSHSSSLDNLLANPDLANEQTVDVQNSDHSSSSDSDTYDESNTFEKSDGQFDTIKRKKGKKHKSSSSLDEGKSLETTQELSENTKSSSEDEDEGHKTPQPETPTLPSSLSAANQQSRDSGFIGSCDDLLREQPETSSASNSANNKTETTAVFQEKKPTSASSSSSASTTLPPATSLTRKDSFNNWSSDEETNLMMCKMRQFFKTLVNSSKPSVSAAATPGGSCAGAAAATSGASGFPSPRVKNRCKPPQLVYFENELTRLMKTVPGIRDDQVREIVEYLSSEDTWSDSYDSSDYTSSDLEGTNTKAALQQQISDSCKQIINKFDNTIDDEGDEGDGGIADETHGLNRETAFVYQKLVASFEKMAAGDNAEKLAAATPHSSPPLIAKVMHHIGSRLVALMHEVSSGESHTSNSPKARHYHRRLQQKLSSTSTTTTEDDDSTSDSNFNDTLGGMETTSFAPYNLLPRSRSHDLLVGESKAHHQCGVSDVAEEREASDCERFSWRGSFESALLATDSRNKLSLLGSEGSSSASALALAAKRRSAGDLLFSHKSLSREQLDRVRSCGSIGGANSEDKLWVASATRPTRRRSSVPDATCGSGGSADGEDDDDDDELESRTTLPRSLQSSAATTNSLPRLPTNTSSSSTAAASMQKAQSMHHFLPPNAKSARYRPPGFSRLITTVPKRAVSAPGLQPSHQRRQGRRSQQHNVPSDDVSISEAHSSPMLASRNGSKSATPSPVAPSSRRAGSVSSQDWSSVNADDDIDRLVVMHQRSSLSSLGVWHRTDELRSDSMASVYSGAGEGRYGTVRVQGQVEFGLLYNYKAGALEILIKQCKDLAPVDVKRNRSDPYVKVYLLPDKSKSGKRKTKVKKHTLNPVFEESLKFHISLNGLETRTLWLTVWHSDMFGRNDFLGEVMMTLENKVFDDPTPMWYNLQERTEPFDDMLSFKGDIIVCLKFVPPDMTISKKGKRSRGTLQVLVKEAKSLTAVKANGTSDPFCKSYLLPEKGRSSKQKTPVAKRTVNPVWNYTFVYDDVTLQELAERCLELTVWDHDRLASNEFLGGVRFSLGTGKHYGKPVEWMDATGKEHGLWKSMLERPNFWVEGCLSLRPSLDTRVS